MGFSVLWGKRYRVVRVRAYGAGYCDFYFERGEGYAGDDWEICYFRRALCERERDKPCISDCCGCSLGAICGEDEAGTDE